MGELSRRAAALAAGTLLLASSLVQVAADDGLPTAWRQGIATNYGGAQDGMDPYQYSFGTSIGSCGYGKLDKSKYPYWSVAALSTQNMYYLAGPVQGCGECFEIECLQNNGQFAGRCNQDPNARMVTVMITDSCPECEPNHMDLQALTFNKVAPMALGRIDMRYRRVECKPPSDMTVIVDQNRGAGGWIRLQVKDAAVRGSIKLVQIKGPNTDWESMNNVWGASWEATSIPDPPLDFRIQDDKGTEVTAFGVIKANGQTGEMPVGVNFEIGNGPSSGPAMGSSSSSPGECIRRAATRRVGSRLTFISTSPTLSTTALLVATTPSESAAARCAAFHAWCQLTGPKWCTSPHADPPASLLDAAAATAAFHRCLSEPISLGGRSAPHAEPPASLLVAATAAHLFERVLSAPPTVILAGVTAPSSGTGITLCFILCLIIVWQQELERPAAAPTTTTATTARLGQAHAHLSACQGRPGCFNCGS
ncbi:probable Expansin-A2 at N-terminal half [Coccomyxa sp. Obi]|nr:probable Expansin-A2 at N-terminal half [Coccomyxa sp. Obi]